jgi:hypothetical protein
MTNFFDIEFQVLLPYKTTLNDLTVGITYEKETWVTEITIGSPPVLNTMHGTQIISSRELHSESVVHIKTKFPFSGTKEEAINHLSTSAGNGIVNLTTSLVERLNKFLNYLRYSAKHHMSSVAIRNVGLLDLSYYTVSFETNVIMSRNNPNIFANLGVKDVLEPKNFTENIPNEWIMISRAQDLVNHGFFSEGLIVAFALLDSEVQSFIRHKMSYLNDNEKEDILRGIEKKRLSTYLGALSKLLIGTNILDDEKIKGDLKWFNNKRNEVMHNGSKCTSMEAKKGLEIVLSIFKKLKEFDYPLEIPDEIFIW